jgi:predicted DCC family thiol-disulfide oxidoreductase YuxK
MPGSAIDSALPDLTVLFDADCGFCGRSAVVVHRLDRARRIRFTPLQRGVSTIEGAPSLERLIETIHVVDTQGHWTTGGEAWLRIMDLVPVLRPLAWIGRLPGARALVEPAYELVATHRHELRRLLGASACKYTPPAPPGQVR